MERLLRHCENFNWNCIKLIERIMFFGFRYMRNSSPYEYTLTFSPLNAYVILPGLFLVIVPQVTGPVYGWGKYNLIPGKQILSFNCRIYYKYIIINILRLINIIHLLLISISMLAGTRIPLRPTHMRIFGHNNNNVDDADDTLSIYPDDYPAKTSQFRIEDFPKRSICVKFIRRRPPVR